MKKLFITILTIFSLFSLSFFTHSSFAIECGDDIPSGPDSEQPLKDYRDNCISKINDLQGQQKTLSSTISFLNSQINLAQAEIAQSEQELDVLELEIDDLTGKIDSIDFSLDDLTILFITRVKQSYKQRISDTGFALFNSTGFSDFFRRLEYIKKVRDHDREVMISLEKSRLDYDTQKTTKEEKQAEVEALQFKLESQRNSLAQQKSAKNKLLADTRNSEKQYQLLLSEAQTQLASFSRFITGQGGASILSGQTSCDDWGCYYNQRDSQWGNQAIGLSNSSMAEYGCLVTSMAMIASHYGKNITPGQIASSSSPFYSSTAYMLQGEWSVNGVSTTRTRLGYSTSLIDSELDAGRPVIVGIYGGPDHFLVIKSKVNGEYIMNDPYTENGKDLKFTDKYPLGAISVVHRVTVN